MAAKKKKQKQSKSKPKRSKPPGTAPQKTKIKRQPKASAEAAAPTKIVELKDGMKLIRRRGKEVVEIIVGKSMCPRIKHKLTAETIYLHPKRGTLQCKKCKADDSKVWMRNKRAGGTTPNKSKPASASAVEKRPAKTKAGVKKQKHRRAVAARKAVRMLKTAGPKGGGPPKPKKRPSVPAPPSSLLPGPPIADTNDPEATLAAS